MKYEGKYEIFDFTKIKRYPISRRPNKVKIDDLVKPDEILNAPLRYEGEDLKRVAKAVIDAKKNGYPVIWASGAHIIKNGMGPLIIDLAKEGMIDIVGVNGAFTIHDFELALFGETSENVPNALFKGEFGFAYETGRYLNLALSEGNRLHLGYGETLGRFISGELYIGERVFFKYPEYSVIYNLYKLGIPLTVHVAIGDDIHHMHPEFDPEAIGGTSGRDFGIFAEYITKLTQGGVCLLTGSAVIMVEVYLKAFSMAANIGKPPNGIVTADFDLRPARLSDVRDDTTYTYYFRDVKSLVTRIPESFGGKGYYIMGDHRDTITSFYKMIKEMIKR